MLPRRSRGCSSSYIIRGQERKWNLIDVTISFYYFSPPFQNNFIRIIQTNESGAYSFPDKNILLIKVNNITKISLLIINVNIIRWKSSLRG